jgi:hypothetical protein
VFLAAFAPSMLKGMEKRARRNQRIKAVAVGPENVGGDAVSLAQGIGTAGRSARRRAKDKGPRTHSLKISLNSEEITQLRKAANEHDVSVSCFVVEAALGASVPRGRPNRTKPA